MKSSARTQTKNTFIHGIRMCVKQLYTHCLFHFLNTKMYLTDLRYLRDFPAMSNRTANSYSYPLRFLMEDLKRSFRTLPQWTGEAPELVYEKVRYLPHSSAGPKTKSRGDNFQTRTGASVFMNNFEPEHKGRALARWSGGKGGGGKALTAINHKHISMEWEATQGRWKDSCQWLLKIRREGVDSIHMVEYNDQWRAFVNTVIRLQQIYVSPGDHVVNYCSKIRVCAFKLLADGLKLNVRYFVELLFDLSCGSMTQSVHISFLSQSLNVNKRHSNRHRQSVVIANSVVLSQEHFVANCPLHRWNI
jgi:hypothetical protein